MNRNMENSILLDLCAEPGLETSELELRQDNQVAVDCEKMDRRSS